MVIRAHDEEFMFALLDILIAATGSECGKVPYVIHHISCVMIELEMNRYRVDERCANANFSRHPVVL